MEELDDLTTKTEMIERRTLVGPTEKSDDIHARLAQEGFRLIRSGPYCDKKIWPKCDVSRFMIVAERDANHEAVFPKLSAEDTQKMIDNIRKLKTSST